MVKRWLKPLTVEVVLYSTSIVNSNCFGSHLFALGFLQFLLSLFHHPSFDQLIFENSDFKTVINQLITRSGTSFLCTFTRLSRSTTQSALSHFQT